MRSMTGYGAGRADAPMARIVVEIRSVNQRFLDVKVATPREYASLEREVRDRVRAVAERGRVEVSITRTPLAGRRRYRVAARLDLARAYVASARALARGLRLPGEVSLAEVLRLPDLFEVFDFADPSLPTGARNTSTVAPQALFMLNSPWVRDRAKALA